ncbi:hypothetical protein A1O1_02303 [Capronia coronata CBS 617.96]|uniref:C2H2-type domain-containing protein n=1 Tax=Capronia coronata CBS 617.96 TaxID=1182541 RepID=W9YW77_9EURO|nr:uncharacterized protein A1O1_02303 [Capronia coronata CBS 617.96]EXJ93910.1 hypothetical protein A1O1_02303 [Capronia coronata CBS 617.96]
MVFPALLLHTGDRPDLPARVSIHDESHHGTKQPFQTADHTQRALHSQQTWDSAEADGLLNQGVRSKSRTLPYPYHPDHYSDNLAGDRPCLSGRSNSLNSLSTLQRETEAEAAAAPPSLYKGSPISAISPPCLVPTRFTPIKQEQHHSCPSRSQSRVEILNEQRRYQKSLRKTLKREQKAQQKAQKEDERLRRAFLAAEVAASRRKNATRPGDSLSSRSKSIRPIASQLVNGLVDCLTSKQPLGRPSRRVRQAENVPPTLDDFDSKQEIHDYFHPPSATSEMDIAELPADLPQYTPFQDSTRTQDNEPTTLLKDVDPAKEKERGSPTTQHEDRQDNPGTAPKSMRCDSCQNPICLNEIYYHCSICESGDRILCSNCDRAGRSCRHAITEKVRSVSRAVSSEQTMDRESSRPDTQQCAVAPEGISMMDSLGETEACIESLLQPSLLTVNSHVCSDVLDRKKSRHACHETKSDAIIKPDQVKETELRRRERDLVDREKEIALRERDVAIRERQASLEVRESASAIQQQLFAFQLQSAMLRRTEEASMEIGSQFQGLSINESNHLRNHGTKRKAGGGRNAGFPTGTSVSHQQSPPKRSPSGCRDSSEEDDEEDTGTPKKIRQTLESRRTAGHLFACPFSKFDRARYSTQNEDEKNYRRCSSGYWPDISRLKQHLYRVHWRGIHCPDCYAEFKDTDQLQAHMRAESPCAKIDCPYPEKFDEAQESGIRQKRPGKTAEQVWYIIYGILFPGHPLPDSPYPNNVDTTPLSAVSSAAAENQDPMHMLAEVFESRLDQHVEASEQAWVRSPQAREFIRQQLRESVADVLERLDLASNLSVQPTPCSALAPHSTRGSSISLTPTSSVTASPTNGPAPRESRADIQLLPPGPCQSFSRPISAGTRHGGLVSESVAAVQKVQPLPNQMSAKAEASTTDIAHHAAANMDPENDHYDDQCNNWSHWDELGLALSTDFNFDFGPSPPLVPDEVRPLQTSSMQSWAPAQGYVPVKLSSVIDVPDAPAATTASPLKPNHSTTSSIDSGYGSMGLASATSLGGEPSAATKPKKTRPRREKMKGTEVQAYKEASPVLEADVNYDALGVPFDEFLDGMGMDEFGNVAGETLTAYLDTQYTAASDYVLPV